MSTVIQYGINEQQFIDIEPNQEQCKSGNAIDQNEFVLVFNTNHVILKMQQFIIPENVTKDDVDEFIKRYEIYDGEFIKSYGKYLNFEKYHNILFDSYKNELEKMKLTLVRNETDKCDKFLIELEDSVCRNNIVNEIIESMKNNQVDESKKKFEEFRKPYNDAINQFIMNNKITNDNNKLIHERFSNICGNIEKSCNKIFEINSEYERRYDELIQKYHKKLLKIKDEFAFESFDDQSDEIDELQNRIGMLRDSYIDKDIICEDKCKPPVQMHNKYIEKIREIYSSKWENDLQMYVRHKYKDLLMKICERNENSIKDIGENKLSEDEIMYIDGMSENYISMYIYEKLVNIVEKSEEDIYYVGDTYRKLTYYRCPKKYYKTHQINKKYHGIHTNETVPEFLVSNEKIRDELFKCIPIEHENGINNLYIFIPKNEVMFQKYERLIEMIGDIPNIGEYFGVSVTKMLNIKKNE